MSEKNITTEAMEPTQETTQVTTIRTADTNDLATPQIFGGGSSALQFWTSIPDNGDSRKRAAQVSKLMGAADMPLKAYRDKVIEVEHLLAHNVTVISEIRDANGRVIDEVPVEATRVIFLLTDGTTADSTSGGVVSSLKNIFALAGMPPWSPGLKISLKENDTRRGRRVYSLLISE